MGFYWGEAGEIPGAKKKIDLEKLDEPVRRAFMCHLCLATVQELVIQRLDTSNIES